MGGIQGKSWLMSLIIPGVKLDPTPQESASPQLCLSAQNGLDTPGLHPSEFKSTVEGVLFFRVPTCALTGSG